MKKLTITRPDDWHCHLRDGAYLERTVPDAASQFQRVVVMPNLIPPVVTAEQALEYRQRILRNLQQGMAFEPLMTLYLTDHTTPAMIRTASSSEFIIAAKLYPAGATTNSDSGVTQIQSIYPALEAMQESGLTLCVHGEITRSEIDVFEREARFIDEILLPLHEQFPELRIVLEHISTAYAVDFIRSMNDKFAATITAHHLLLNRNDLLVGSIKPHYYCLPILKKAIDQTALIQAATSGNPKFFLGTDSAPHAKEKKESACGCAGIYTAHAALELYATVFEEAKALDKLEGFASFFGADFYRLPRNKTQITLVSEPNTIPDTLAFGTTNLIPFYAGQTLKWSLSDEKK